VRTLDTNVVVRLLIGDDPQQTSIAERAFLEAIAAGGGSTSLIAHPRGRGG
jgi:predicted nucleic-acid-binding protein